MKRFFLGCVFLLLAQLCLAQVPNCTINWGPYQVNTTSTYFDNRVTACPYWVLTYQVTGFSAASVAVQSATGALTAGSFSTAGLTVASGSNPSTSVACSTPSNCTITLTGVVGWIRVNVTGLVGSGSIIGTLQGYKTGYNLGGNAGGAACPSPCPVEGVTAAGSPPTAPPVLQAGQDGTNTQTILTDSSGRQYVIPFGTTIVEPIGQGTFSAGQQAVTATAAALPTAASRSACVQALIANTINVFVGPSGVTTSTGFQLVPGAVTCQPVSNTNLLFVVASTTGASVAWTLTD